MRAVRCTIALQLVLEAVLLIAVQSGDLITSLVGIHNNLVLSGDDSHIVGIHPPPHDRVVSL